MRFDVPDKLTNDSVRRALEQFATLLTVARSSNETNVVFDFTNCDFISPVGMALLACFEDTLTTLKKNSIAHVQPHNKLFGLLADFGIISTKVTKRQIADKYSIEVHRCMSSDDGLNLANKILPHILSKTDCLRSTKAALNWALWEIFDNAGCHGYQCYEVPTYPLPVYACAFSYSDHVEIAVLDRGCGIQQSLQKSYGGIGAKRALDLAIEKGVSGHPLGSAGFGLYATSRLAMEGHGTFLLLSSGRGLKVSRAGQKAFSCPNTIGTIVSLSLKRDIEVPFQRIIGRPPDDFFEDFLIS